jgi:UDP-N-acetylmuramoylalanine--D-glutamate ligase
MADERTIAMVHDAEVSEGCRAIGFTLDAPRVGELGVVEPYLVDRAFGPSPATQALELAEVADVRPLAPHNVANALAAAALARAFGVGPAAIRDGLVAFRPAGHRISDVAVIGGVRYVDDSKATNAHAANTSLQAYESVVWIAGGLAKGQSYDDLVVDCRDRIRSVVLLGQDRSVIVDALARHAPQIPVVEVSATDTGAMAEVVRSAANMAQPGDTVLLAPGCASWDMFDSYAQRGDRFAEEVLRLDGGNDSEQTERGH